MYKKVNFIALILLFASITIVGCNKKTDSESTHEENADDSFNYLACVVDENFKCGFINEYGDEIISCKYKLAGNFQKNGLAKVSDDTKTKYGYIDKTGKEIIPLEYDDSCQSSDGELLALAKGVKSYENDRPIYNWAIFNNQGVQLTDFKYQYAISPSAQENKYNVFVVAQKSNSRDVDGNIIYNCGVINNEGEEVIPIGEQIIDYGDEPIGNSGLIGVGREQEDGSLKYGFMNFKNEVVIPFIYEQVHNFSDNGLAAVQKDGLWGYINMSGKTVIPFQYKSANSFGKNGLAFVKDNLGRYINANGDTIISGDWDIGDEFDEFGIASVGITKDDSTEFGQINANGDIIIACGNTDEIYHGGIIQSKISDEIFKYQILDTDNTFHELDDKYTWATEFGDNHWAAVKEKGNEADKIVFIDQNQNIKLESNKKYRGATPFKRVY